MVGSSIYTVTSVLTQRELDHHRSVFNIRADLRPELPDRNATIKDSPAGKIGMHTRFIEFANFWIPLSKFLLCVLEYYQINLSQLSVIGAAKVSHFEIMCHVFGRVPTVGTFRCLYVNSISNGWLSFSKRGGFGDPCCYSKKFDSLKNWNNRFFWIDASVCPLSISWFSGVSVVKDPLPVDEAVDLPCVELLNENRTLSRKYLEIFLCLVGLSRLFTETDVCPTLLYSDDEETEDRVISPSAETISLVDPTIHDELQLNTGNRKKRVAFIFGSPLVKKARAEGVVISKPWVATASKSPTALRRLIKQIGQTNIGYGSATRAMEDFVSSSAIPTSVQDYEDESGPDVNVIPPAPSDEALVETRISSIPDTVEFLSTSANEAGTLSATPSQSPHVDDFYESQTIDSVTAQNIYAPKWAVTNNAQIDNSATCKNFLDPGYWAALRNQGDTGFLDTFNINSAQHVCMASELHLRYEHEIMTQEKFERKFTDSVAVVQQRDAEVADLRAKLEKAEGEATEMLT
ncbi:hypothetical protein Tco_0540881 [Tanacetum coccineum]